MNEILAAGRLGKKLGVFFEASSRPQPVPRPSASRVRTSLSPILGERCPNSSGLSPHE